MVLEHSTTLSPFAAPLAHLGVSSATVIAVALVVGSFGWLFPCRRCVGLSGPGALLTLPSGLGVLTGLLEVLIHTMPSEPILGAHGLGVMDVERILAGGWVFGLAFYSVGTPCGRPTYSVLLLAGAAAVSLANLLIVEMLVRSTPAAIFGAGVLAAIAAAGAHGRHCGRGVRESARR